MVGHWLELIFNKRIKELIFNIRIKKWCPAALYFIISKSLLRSIKYLFNIYTFRYSFN